MDDERDLGARPDPRLEHARGFGHRDGDARAHVSHPPQPIMGFDDEKVPVKERIVVDGKRSDASDGEGLAGVDLVNLAAKLNLQSGRLGGDLG